MEINSKKIKDIRIKRGFSQEYLAEKSGLSLRTIQRIENGETIPRGDSLKRIALALETSIELFVSKTKQKDENIITILNLSQLVFLLFPPLSVVVPLFIWIKKKEKIDNVERVGKSILNFQISWNILLLILMVFFFFNVITSHSGGQITFKGLLPIAIIILLYFYNLLMITINTIFYKIKRNVYYMPSLRFLN